MATIKSKSRRQRDDQRLNAGNYDDPKKAMKCNNCGAAYKSIAPDTCPLCRSTDTKQLGGKDD